MSAPHPFQVGDRVRWAAPAGRDMKVQSRLHCVAECRTVEKAICDRPLHKIRLVGISADRRSFIDGLYCADHFRLVARCGGVCT